MTASGMTGRYADGRVYVLPRGWEPVAPGLLEIAQRQAAALLGGLMLESSVFADHFATRRGRADLLALSLDPNPPQEVGPADLLAVAVATPDIPVGFVEDILDPLGTQARLRRCLRLLGNTHHPLTDLQPGMLDAMLDLHVGFRDAWPADRTLAHQVAHLACVRKRPELFPSHDPEVLVLLTGDQAIRARGPLARFCIAVQLSAYLLTDAQVAHLLDDACQQLERHVGEPLGGARLIVLNVALSSAVTRAFPRPRPEVPTGDRGEVTEPAHAATQSGRMRPC